MTYMTYKERQNLMVALANSGTTIKVLSEIFSISRQRVCQIIKGKTEKRICKDCDKQISNHAVRCTNCVRLRNNLRDNMRRTIQCAICKHTYHKRCKKGCPNCIKKKNIKRNNRIKLLWNKGKTAKEIADKLNMSKEHVFIIIHNMKKEGKNIIRKK